MSAPPGEVVDRLERLAAHAPRGRSTPTAVWTRGGAGSAVGWVVVAACVAVLAGARCHGRRRRWSGGSTRRSRTAPDAPAWSCPTWSEQPGRWEPAFPTHAGRLSAVGVGLARSRLWSSRNAVVGRLRARRGSRASSTCTAMRPICSARSGALGRRQAAGLLDRPGRSTGEPMTWRRQGLGRRARRGRRGAATCETGEREVLGWSSPTHGLSTSGLAWAGDVLWWSAGSGPPGGPTMSSAELVHPHLWTSSTGDSVEPTASPATPGLPERRPGTHPAVSSSSVRDSAQPGVVARMTRRRTLRHGLPAGAPWRGGTSGGRR